MIFLTRLRRRRIATLSPTHHPAFTRTDLLATSAADNTDTIVNFSWEFGQQYTLPNGVSIFGNSNDVRNHRFQEWGILQQITGRFGGPDDIELNDSVIPHRRWRYLVLTDYLSGDLPEPIVASPHDQNLLRWQADETNSNPGWDASTPQDTGQSFTLAYFPIDADFFPPPLFETDGDTQDEGFRIQGRFLWTRGGLRGLDFGGNEIDTTNWPD